MQWMEGEQELSMRTNGMNGIARTSSGSGQLKWRSPPKSDIVAFGGIDRKFPIYRPIPDIVRGVL